MRILIYKRRFGNGGCMGRVRDFPFDAVIGVGGISRQPTRQGIAGKINWAGRNPKKSKNWADSRGQLVSFDPEDFRLFEQQGPPLHQEAPLLAKRILRSNSRFVFRSLNPAEQKEAEQLIYRILDLREFDHLHLTKPAFSKCINACNKSLTVRGYSKSRIRVAPKQCASITLHELPKGITRGEKAVKNNRTVTHEQAKQRMARWLKNP